MTHVYTRERHENKNTRFWATHWGYYDHCAIILLEKVLLSFLLTLKPGPKKTFYKFLAVNIVFSMIV